MEISETRYLYCLVFFAAAAAKEIAWYSVNRNYENCNILEPFEDFGMILIFFFTIIIFLFIFFVLWLSFGAILWIVYFFTSIIYIFVFLNFLYRDWMHCVIIEVILSLKKKKICNTYRYLPRSWLIGVWRLWNDIVIFFY